MMSDSRSAQNADADSSTGVADDPDGDALLSIATWNVNSIKARLDGVCRWLEDERPDIACLQELKCETEKFPYQALADIGYRAEVHGQKSYNGVAILHRHTASNVVTGLPGDADDTHARYIEADIGGLRVICLYLPNGNPAMTDESYSEKYKYKLAWLDRLHDRLAALLSGEIPVVACGDYNVIPDAIDCHDPRAWETDALFLPDTRRAFRRIANMGYYDAFRALHPDDAGAYTFWDYQAGAWQHNHGIRIDHALLSPQAVDRLDSARIDSVPRGRDKASDHTPLVITVRR